MVHAGQRTWKMGRRADYALMKACLYLALLLVANTLACFNLSQTVDAYRLKTADLIGARGNESAIIVLSLRDAKPTGGNQAKAKTIYVVMYRHGGMYANPERGYFLKTGDPEAMKDFPCGYDYAFPVPAGPYSDLRISYADPWLNSDFRTYASGGTALRAGVVYEFNGWNLSSRLQRSEIPLEAYRARNLQNVLGFDFAAEP